VTAQGDAAAGVDQRRQPKVTTSFVIRAPSNVSRSSPARLSGSPPGIAGDERVAFAVHVDEVELIVGRPLAVRLTMSPRSRVQGFP
jgi:hypothetical protein